MPHFSLKYLCVAELALAFTCMQASTVQANDISEYLTGEIKHLYAVQADVNVHDILLVSAFDKDGKTIERLAEKQGKVLLVTFWSKTCLQCRRHLKQLAAVQSLVGTDTLEVIAINLDGSSFKRIRRTLDDRGLSSLAAYQDFNKNIPYRLKADPDLHFFGREPKTLVVGPSGQVRAVANTRKNWSAPESVAFLKALKSGRL